VENHVFLRQVELRSRLRRVLAILKTRESAHDTTLREFHITDQGFVIGSAFEEQEALLTDSRPAVAAPPRRKAVKAKPKRPRGRS
ncbi:MAG TPA: ATPase domain-containing protein, partial [Myxococcaceae bacterium]|nr:ATPase domain-containing protein [Myxococcaceae bacterium]